MLVIAWVIISSLCCSLWSLPFLRSSLDCLQSLLLSHFRLHRGGCFFRFLMIWFNLIGPGRVLKVFLAIPAKIFWRLGRPVAFLGKTIGWLWVWQNLWWFVGAKETHKLPSREALGRFVCYFVDRSCVLIDGWVDYCHIFGALLKYSWCHKHEVGEVDRLTSKRI